MTREVMKIRLAKPTAHAMRAAALRLAREGAGEGSESAAGYGCVDWFRYDVVPPPQTTHGPPPLGAAPAGAEHYPMPPAH
jgi:hypothetical protein